MKKICLLATSLLLFSVHGHCQWTYGYLLHARNGTAVQAIEPNDYIAVGGTGPTGNVCDIFTHYSAYVEWDPLVEDRTPTFTGVNFPVPLIGYVVGYSGQILKSPDGGGTWNALTVPDSVITRDFNAVYFIDSLTGYVVGGAQDSIQTIIKTSNGGKSWTIQLDSSGSWLTSIYFMNADTGFAVGYNGTVLQTIDSGNNWSPVALTGAVATRSFNAVSFINNTSIGFIVGGDSLNQTILRTIDAGNTWNTLLDTGGPILNGVSFVDTTFGYIVGAHGIIWKSINAGVTWNVDPSTLGINDTITLNSVSFYNHHLGVTVGNEGKVLLYFDTTVYKNSHDSTTGNYPSGLLIQMVVTGKVNPGGQSTNVSFVYGTTVLLGDSSLASPGTLTGSGWQPVSDTLNGLASATQYYYRVKSVSAAGTGYGDLMSFITPAILPPTDSTVNAFTIAPNTEEFNSLVSSNYLAAKVKFEYGATPALGDSIFPATDSIQASFTTYVSATVSGLTTGKKYYFRGVASNALGIAYGAIDSFIVAQQPIPLDTTLPASDLTSTGAQLNGIVNANGSNTVVYFLYGAGSSFSDSILATPDTVLAANSQSVSTILSGLTPNIQYIFEVKATSATGTNYSNPAFFSTFSFGTIIDSTHTASEVSSTSATLNGIVNAQGIASTVTFEYGLTTDLGVTVDAIPATVTGSNWQTVYADLSDLDSNTEYYYRVAAVNGSDSSFGNILQFYTGNPDIPNWDFELWDTLTEPVPVGWNAIGGVAQVPYDSGWAAQLYSTGPFNVGILLLNSYTGGGGSSNIPPFYGGVPYQARPDSIAGYFNYNIVADDSGVMAVFFKKNDTLLFYQFNYVVGSSNGNFERLSFPIIYPSGNTIPDSVIIILLNSDLFINNGPPGKSENILTVANLSFIGNDAPTIPGGDFANWHTLSSVYPEGWSPQPPMYQGLNDLIEQTTESYTGRFALRLNNEPQFEAKGGVQNSFPIHTRHLYLNGYYQWDPVGNDVLQINVNMMKNGQNIGGGNSIISAAISGYQQFTVNIGYSTDSSIIPDSCNIQINTAINTPVSNSVAYIDHLSFDGTIYAGMQKISLTGEAPDNLIVYPNPTSGILNIQFFAKTPGNTVYRIYDLCGRMMANETENIAAPSKVTKLINVSGLMPGVYILNVINGENTLTTKIIMQ